MGAKIIPQVELSNNGSRSLSRYHLKKMAPTPMKKPERWRPSRVVPSLSVFLPHRPSNTDIYPWERWLTDTHIDGHTDGTDFIPSTGDAGGKNNSTSLNLCELLLKNSRINNETLFCCTCSFWYWTLAQNPKKCRNIIFIIITSVLIRITIIYGKMPLFCSR